MEIVHLTQGSPEWLAHRMQHNNASDAPAMMGCSKYKTRSDFVREIATGLGEEITPEKQRLFDAGHAYEPLARPLAEAILGEELYPVVGTKGKLSASFDGLTLLYDKAWEHKTLNDELRRVLPVDGVGGPEVGAALPLMYRVQMEQQAEVSDCEMVLFTASKWNGDQLVEARHCWYQPDLELRARILAGWEQFEADVCAYQPAEVTEVIEVVGHRPDQLPALRSKVTGELVLESNIKEWESAALAYIKSVRDHELKTDEDFANADEAAKWCDSSKEQLLGLRANLMSATGDVNTAVATLDRIAAELDKTRIAFTNAIKARKEARKAELVLGVQAKLREHCEALSLRVGLPITAAADFAGVMKNLKSFASMEDKLSTELTRAKIAATQTADLVEVNRKAMTEADAAHLFPDFAQVCSKAADDFVNLISSRKAEAQKRLDAERVKRHTDNLAKFAGHVERARGLPAARIQTIIESVEAIIIDPAAWQEYAEQAQNKKSAALAALLQLRDEAQKDEAPKQEIATAAPAADSAAAASPAATLGSGVTPASGQREAPQPAAPAPEVVPLRAAAQAANEAPTLTLGEIKTRIAPLSIDANGLESLGFPAKKERGACLYRESQWPAMHAALVQKLLAAGPQQRAA